MADISTLIDQNRDDLLKRLPKYLSTEQFFQLCKQLDRDPKIRAVAQRNPDSVLNCIYQAADCGLVIGGPFDHCWVAPFGDSVELLIGWRGFVYQWMVAGAVIKVVSQCVYVGDDKIGRAHV